MLCVGHVSYSIQSCRKLKKMVRNEDLLFQRLQLALQRLHSRVQRLDRAHGKNADTTVVHLFSTLVPWTARCDDRRMQGRKPSLEGCWRVGNHHSPRRNHVPHTSQSDGQHHCQAGEQPA